MVFPVTQEAIKVAVLKANPMLRPASMNSSASPLPRRPQANPRAIHNTENSTTSAHAIPGARKGAASADIGCSLVTAAEMTRKNHHHGGQSHRSTESKDQSSPEIVIQSECPRQQISDKQIAMVEIFH